MRAGVKEAMAGGATRTGREVDMMISLGEGTTTDRGVVTAIGPGVATTMGRTKADLVGIGGLVTAVSQNPRASGR